MVVAMTPDRYFSGAPTGRALFDALHAEVEALGPVEMRVTKSQVAFARARTFAWAWMPDQYLGSGHAPLVFTVSFREPHPAAEWKEIVQTGTHRFTHHREIWTIADIDVHVQDSLRAAWAQAG